MDADAPDRAGTTAEDRPRDLGWRPALASFAGAVLLAAAFHLHAGFVNDDALITARYSVHLAEGHGLVYNPGERVLGTTTPLWALLLAGVAAVGLDPVAWASGLGIAAHGAAAALTSVLFRNRGATPLAQVAAGAVVGSLPILLIWSGSGMETPLAVAWTAAILVLYESERWGALGWVGGAAVLTRPDLGLVLAAAAVLHVARTRTFLPILRAAPGFALVTLPWIVGAGLYFGSPLPNSGFAKRLQVEDWGTYLTLIGREFWRAAPLLPCAVVGAVAAVAAPRRLLPLVALDAVVLGMHLGGLPGCGWYAPPALFLLAVVAADGAIHAADALRAAGRPAIAVAALAAPLVAASILPDVARDTKTTQHNLERLHGRIGTWLRENAPPDASVGVDNIGYIGWRSGLRVVDMLGLVQGGTAEAIGRGERDFALRHHRPELIAAWARRGNTWKYMPPEAWFREQGYVVAFEVPVDPSRDGGPAYTVWSRVRLPGAEDPPR